MTIYEVYIQTGDFYSPFEQIGIYSDFEVAKKFAEEKSIDSESLYVYALDLVGEEFTVKQTWHNDLESDDSLWCLQED